MKNSTILAIVLLSFAWGQKVLCGPPPVTYIQDKIVLANKTGKDLIIYSNQQERINKKFIYPIVASLAPDEEKTVATKYLTYLNSYGMFGDRIKGNILTVAVKEIPFTPIYKDPKTGKKQPRKNRPDMLDIAIQDHSTAFDLSKGRPAWLEQVYAYQEERIKKGQHNLQEIDNDGYIIDPPGVPKSTYKVTLSLDQNGNIVCDKCMYENYLR